MQAQNFFAISFVAKIGAGAWFLCPEGVLRYFEWAKKRADRTFFNRFCCKNGSECAFYSTDGILRYFEGEKMCRHDVFRNKKTATLLGGCFLLVLATTYLPGR